jgi:hypothetical protein
MSYLCKSFRAPVSCPTTLLLNQRAINLFPPFSFPIKTEPLSSSGPCREKCPKQIRIKRPAQVASGPPPLLLTSPKEATATAAVVATAENKPGSPSSLAAQSTLNSIVVKKINPKVESSASGEEQQKEPQSEPIVFKGRTKSMARRTHDRMCLPRLHSRVVLSERLKSQRLFEQKQEEKVKKEREEKEKEEKEKEKKEKEKVDLSTPQLQKVAIPSILYFSVSLLCPRVLFVVYTAAVRSF